MLRHTFARLSRPGPIWPPGTRGPGRLRSAAHTIGCSTGHNRVLRRPDLLFSTPTIAASSISAAAAVGNTSCTSIQCRRTGSSAHACVVVCQRRTISVSYCRHVPCIRFNMCTERLARATAQPTLPAHANIFMIDVRKSQRKSKRVNPRSTMASIVTAHRAEAQKAKEGPNKGDAYIPPLIFLFRTDDTKKQAARRQEQMDTFLSTLDAFGEFRVCVLDGIKSRNWTRYIDSPTTPDRLTPDQTESASSRDVLHTASLAAAVAGATAVDPEIMLARGSCDAPASPFPILGDAAEKEGNGRTDTAEGPAVAVVPRVPPTGATGVATGAHKEMDNAEGEDEEVWEEVEVEVEVDEGEEMVEGVGSGDGGTNNAADGDDINAFQPWKAATYVDHTAAQFVPARVARARAPADENVTAPSTAKRSVNTVWAHVKNQAPSGGSAVSSGAPVAAAEATSQEHGNTVGEKAINVADLDANGVSANAPSPAAPSLVDHTDKANGVSIPDAPLRSVPDNGSGDSAFLANAHAPLLAEEDSTPDPLLSAADRDASISLEDLEEFDIDGPLGESTTAPAAEGEESSATAKVAAVSLSGDDGITAAVETSREASSRAHLIELAAQDDGPTLALSEGAGANTEVEGKEGEEIPAITTVEDNSNGAASTVAAPAAPAPPPKPSVTMPVYPHVVSRLYYGATTVYLSDRAFIELPATANVLVIDHLDWDDAHLMDIDTALEQVDPVAGHVLLHPDAYAPNSEHVMGDINIYRRSLLPFIFVFRTQLSTEAAMSVQRRLANALHVRPTLGSAAQRSLVAGQNDRTSVCVLSAAESEKGGENPMLAPQPCKVTPASPKPSSVEPTPARTPTEAKVAKAPWRATDAPARERSTTAAASASLLPRAPPATTERKSRAGSTGSVADDAVQRLWDLLNNASFDASSSKKSAASAAAPHTQAELPQRGHGYVNGKEGTAVAGQQRISRRGASALQGNTQAEPTDSGPAEITTNITTSTRDTGEVSNGHVTVSTAMGHATPSPPSRLAYESRLENSEVPAPSLNPSARANAASGAGTEPRKFSAPTHLAESSDTHGRTAISKGGLFNFGTIAFGRDNGYRTAALSQSRRASDPRWGMNDAEDDIDDECNGTDTADDAVASSDLGTVSDLGLYPVSESVDAARAEAARLKNESGGGSPFTDEEIAKIEEEIIVAQLRKQERKERRSEARRAMRAKANAAQVQVSSKSVSSPSLSPALSASSTAKGSRLFKQRLHGSGNGSESSKAMATTREQELAEDRRVEDFISSMMAAHTRSKASNTKKVKVPVSPAPSRGVVRSARRTLATATSSTRKGVKQ
ncbi:hypothetical protein, unknown function [Leishmania tarentolae]|uniref:Uncharacterized protein n=1 Tax=Leishmania tarentolae TaxID=5689 RepID=A0A640KG05_LEITA|nr:hypothetical protein, unknown function [Leishmania tarentolae]